MSPTFVKKWCDPKQARVLGLGRWRTSWAVVTPPTTAIRFATSSNVCCLQRLPVMLSWAVGWWRDWSFSDQPMIKISFPK